LLVGAAVLALGCATTHGEAPAKPTGAVKRPQEASTDTYRKGDFSARHRRKLVQRCGHRCVYRQRGGSTLALKLAEGGQASADDQGQLVERFRSVAGATQHDTAWHRSWKGQWTEEGETVRVTLEPDLTDCTRRTGDGEAEAPCQPTKLELTCEPTKVLTRGKQRASELSWVCAPASPQETTGLTPFPWVFGMENALVMVDRGPTHSSKRLYARPRPKPKKKARLK
jgi:hypothetical protein